MGLPVPPLPPPTPLTDLPQAAKPDMQAARFMKETTRVGLYGHIPGVAVGADFIGRGELCVLGLHTQMMRGIANGCVPPFALALLGVCWCASRSKQCIQTALLRLPLVSATWNLQLVPNKSNDEELPCVAGTEPGDGCHV